MMDITRRISDMIMAAYGTAETLKQDLAIVENKVSGNVKRGQEIKDLAEKLVSELSVIEMMLREDGDVNTSALFGLADAGTIIKNVHILLENDPMMIRDILQAAKPAALIEAIDSLPPEQIDAIRRAIG